MDDNEPTNVWMTYKDASAYLKVSRKHLHRLRLKCKLQAYAYGEGRTLDVRFKKADLDRVFKLVPVAPQPESAQPHE